MICFAASAVAVSSPLVATSAAAAPSLAARGPRATIARNAAKDGDSVLLLRLLQFGWRPGADRDRRGATALHLSAGHGHDSCCEALLPLLDVNDHTREGATPLHFAVAGMKSRRGRGGQNGFGTGGHVGTARLLLDRGADPAAVTSDGNSVVHWAAWAGGSKLLRLLCEEHGQAAAAGAPNAASSGALSSCKYLAESCGLDFGAPNAEGATPLTKAVVQSRPPVVEWLIASPHCSLADLREAAALASRLEKRRTTADAARVAALLRASSSLRLRGGFARCIAPRPSLQAAAPPRASPRAVLPDAPEEDDGVSAPPPSEGDDLGDFGLRRGLGVAVDAVLPTRLVIVAWSVVINVFGVAFGFVPPTVFSQFCGLMRLSM
ncbi:hypothetical protein EMIHUDRAFT_119912 [Emiliania huxleyi CCMP1516]|uniref:Uncharacterized protein n=2 Tax=Emiliania huxleyi TaxID=2903 RepID=A0A0D3IPV6_EMIH1|nr:hypothetical protein EMIHUDRAFT_119912 [Emiliania huxleyi CCMP1516]EOD13291.1 hypothetical protein EMIHUDRAFT_119912 [Emiliania huxleyi CCMP1516]|eukprot:XP_005765720.1 hypothetical protein EMIHUDRAFT_119912 [Emiliania huxleyi CCMP1516]